MSASATAGRVILLGNPASGRGRGAAALSAAAAELERRGIRPEVRRTGAPGDAIGLARRTAEEGAGLLLVIGGDGTVRDVAEGLDGAPVPVAILPGGTGNDIARTLGIPLQLSGALDVALGARERPIDVWRWNETPFVNAASIGFDAAVARTVNEQVRWLRGTLAYLAAVLITLPRFRPLSLRVAWEGGEWAGRCWLAAFANTRSYGGGMRIAPDAAPDDGLLEIVTVGETSKVELLRQFPRVFAGTHTGHPAVRIWRASEVRVEAAPQATNLDGELIGRAPAVITRAPGRLRVRVPG